MFNTLLISIATGAVVSAILTKITIVLAPKLKIIDDPRLHQHDKNTHLQPIPRGGGIPIFLTLLAGVAYFAPGNFRLWAVVLGAAVLAITGYFDDRYLEKVSPYLRLLINILVAGIVVASGIGIAYITNPLGGVIHLDWPRVCLANHCLWVLSDVFALMWLVGLQNIVGWSSGVDGQLPGFVAIAAIAMGILAMRFGADPSQLPVVILAGITAGAYLGFLPFNWYPQKIMPGYGGKSLAGFLLGVLAILSAAKVGALIMILGIPIIDATVVVSKRLLQKRSPFKGGREHLHHLLLDMGWGKRRIAGLYWIMSAILATLALKLNSESKYFTMAAVLAVISAIVLWMHYFSIFSKRPGPDSG